MERKMNKRLWPLFLGGLVSLLPFATAKGNTGELLRRSVIVGDNSYDYQVFVPSKLSDSKDAPVKDAPVIVFLHGIGQRGSGGVVATEGPTGTIVRHYLEKVGAIIVLPQCRAGMYWSTPEMDQMVMKEVDDVKASFKANARRIYLTGVSMGGYGVWHLASQHPGRFAALVSVCGGSSLQTGDRFTPIAKMIGRTPVWIFHGADDDIVPVTESRRMYEAMKRIGAEVLYTEYPGGTHASWERAYDEPKLFPWLFSKSLGAPSKTAQTECQSIRRNLAGRQLTISGAEVGCQGEVGVALLYGRWLSVEATRKSNMQLRLLWSTIWA